jgi:two-component system, NarL family, sensor kinase
MDTYETSIYTAVLITAAVLGCTIVYFAVSVYRQQRNYLRNQRIYFTDEINLLEKERSRVAIDLHDEIGPLLSVIKTHLEQLEPRSEKEIKHLEKTNEYLIRLLKRMREIAVNLTPNALAKKGLEFTLRQFFDDLGEVYSMQFLFTYDVNRKIDTDSSIHLYRIVQEIAHNAIKHAKATELKIHFKERKDRLYVFCQDNGSGFCVGEDNDRKTGIGLSSLKSRTALLKGKMTTGSQIDKGTEYFFEFPFPKGLL